MTWGGRGATVRIRLQRFGRKHQAFYRIVAAHFQSPRDGKFLDVLGTYNPIPDRQGVKHVTLNVERIKYWIEGLDLGDGEEADDKGDSKEMEGLLSWVKDVLGAKVESVVVSRRLGSSPCAVVTSQTGWSANMERIMKAQAMGDNRSFEFMKGKKILEVNPSSPVIQALVAKSAAGKADQEGQAMVDLLYETALITSGFEVESPKDYAARVYDMISSAAAAGGAGSPEDPEVIEPDNSDPFAK